MSEFSRKENSLAMKFDLLFVFVDLKVLFIIFLMAKLYKETVMLSDLYAPKDRQPVINILNHVWQSVGSGMWLLLFGAIIGDIILKRVLREMNG